MGASPDRGAWYTYAGTDGEFVLRNATHIRHEKVVDVQQRLETMQALARYHLDRVQDREKENAEVLLLEEMMKERKRCFNKERSSYRGGAAGWIVIDIRRREKILRDGNSFPILSLNSPER
eukprot:scaffold16349_cov146-Skeletonema_menzelii.AAC.5